MSQTTTSLDADFDYLDWCYDGMESLLNNSSRSYFQGMMGGESFYCLHLDANNYAGMEDKFSDGIKKAARTLYDNIINMLKRIREYFFGDGEKAADDAQANAESSISALMEMSGDTPIPEDSPARNPENYIKSLEGGVEFNELKEENGALSSALDKVKAAAMKVKDAKTVGQLRSVYTEIGKAATAGNRVVTETLRSTVSAAEQAARKLQNAKIPKEDDTSEVKAAIKAENSEVSAKAKEETKKARLVGGVRNKFVGALNSISRMSKGVKEKPVEPKFKG
ncbi:hypothetical protein N1M2_89 [Klebsiella phage N1M2]|uniref:Uncharacterized protein n=1 Tax=Klebsiella phage N1M2 TaxID=2664939 RepID=A0A6B7ZF11_9CAUD|nr:hypothetical protein PQB72_gp089 [Klebsiella phage N1M2]QGH71952.1 hypothetical protein N1M2_89 [Klebsiella phage N1M2]